MRIAVTGATGFVGSHLAEHLTAAGHEVTVLARSPERLAWIRHLPVRVVYGDLDRADALREFTTGQEVVVHAAGLILAASRDEFIRVNVDGSVRLLEAAMASSPVLRRFVYISSQAAMGPSPAGASLEEDAPRRPISAYGESKSLAEQELARFADRVPITFIRPPWVYGPRDRHTLSYFRLAAWGLRIETGPRNRYSIVHAADLAQGIRLAAESTLPGARAYFLTDGDGRTIEQLVRIMADTTGRRTVRVPVPVAVAAVFVAVNELAGAIAHRPPFLGWRKLDEMRNPCWVVSDRRARKELGYRPAITTEQGMAETAAWYRAEGWL
ncbi:MAG: NAD-dependent epimerase/dehydratase family protein [Spirochaetes bacterium]|nr:NAD-dependent epimerase/dehydratase family protein [Spirochaetota bacterium]